ncbi:Lysine-specific demethylase 8 [Chytriomyces hyalinus]|nr:Lysine-specific demethylase 8 [Chytriomyces hyalinus]
MAKRKALASKPSSRPASKHSKWTVTKLNMKQPSNEPTSPSLLSSMPIQLSHMDPGVKSLLAQAALAVEAARSCSAQSSGSHTSSSSTKTTTTSAKMNTLALAALAASEAARESTFPFLEKECAIHTGAYTASCLLVAESHLLLPDEPDSNTKALRAIDLGLLRGGVVDWGPMAASLVERAAAKDVGQQKPQTIEPTPDLKLSDAAKELPPQFIKNSPNAHTIPRIDARSLTLEEFCKTYMEADPPRPVVLTNAIESWPALSRWKSMDYIKQVAKGRLVPVETYAKEDTSLSFLSDSWSHRVIPLDEYIQQYVLDGNKEAPLSDNEAGYLAQHPLFDQIPALRHDIGIPEFCHAVTEQDRNAPPDCEVRSGDAPLVSAWLGPSGTVSPLHNDPYHNLLAQLVGTKYVRIYNACDSAKVYPEKTRLGHNSRVNVDSVDSKKFPLFQKAACWQVVLGPGDLLYIPRHAWHYVRSLSVSFSASFWFGAKMELVEVRKNSYKEEYLKRVEPGEGLNIQ